MYAAFILPVALPLLLYGPLALDRYDQPAAIARSDNAPSSGTSVSGPASDAVATPAGQTRGTSETDVVCMAKVVHHEAANQPVRGQLAVAQLILNRFKAKGAAGTVCGVVNQRGQFFDTRAYSPPRDQRWRVALAVSRAAILGAGPKIVPGAMFYQAAYSPRNWMSGRVRLAQIGGHVFYR